MVPFPRNNDLEKIQVSLNLILNDIKMLYLRTPKEDPAREIILQVLNHINRSIEILKSTNPR